jgi:hypothetical protein
MKFMNVRTVVKKASESPLPMESMCGTASRKNSQEFAPRQRPRDHGDDQDDADDGHDNRGSLEAICGIHTSLIGPGQ